MMHDAPSSEIFSRSASSRECSLCGGRGRMGVPFYLAPSDRRFVGAEDAIPAVVVGSPSIFDVTREARELATRGRRPVAFDFNDVLVVVGELDDPDQVARAWWVKVYGETPEQSAARR